MLKFNTHYNTLDEPLYHYQLQDVKEPNLYRDIYNYEEIPKVTFNRRRVPMSVPDEIWITDTTFRDGQQSRAPYTVEQIAALYEMLHRLGGPKGLIRQSEFFLYSEKDRRAVEKCREMGFEFPEITGWIRAKKEDFLLAKEMGLKECGILVSCSDYHIFKKLGLTRKQALDMYLGIIKDALSVGIKPRCHFEDITRADFYGFVVPFAHEISELMAESGIPIKIRACDTMGYGVPYAGASMPRSVPGIVYGLRNYGSLFVGEETTVAYGDKTIGTNHILPTSRAARYTGGVWVGKFIKTLTYQRCTAAASRETGEVVYRQCVAEQLPGHAATAKMRAEKYK